MTLGLFCNGVWTIDRHITGLLRTGLPSTQEPAMSGASFGEVVRPRHCRVSVSTDKTQIALTFRTEDRTPVSIVLPLEGAAGLQRKLAQSLYLLGVRPVGNQDTPPPEAKAANRA
jgi:hypothetical protein